MRKRRPFPRGRRRDTVALAGVMLLTGALVSRFLLPVALAGVGFALAVMESREWLRLRTRPLLVRLNGHPVHLLDVATVELGERTVQVTRDELDVIVDGTRVRAGRARQIGDLLVEVG